MKPNVFIVARLLLVALVLLVSLLPAAHAQMKVGHPSGEPDGSAALEVSGGPYPKGSPFRGFVPPKVALTNTATALPITKPVTGLLIYNTAQAGDVTPGFYYWEGNKWLRFTTNSNNASARIAGGGQYIPSYTINEAKTQSTDIIYVVDEGKEGMFRYTSGTTPAVDGAMSLSASAGRYNRIFDGTVNARWFGAKGDGATSDQAALQKAINFTQGTSYPLFIPKGVYPVNSLSITAGINILGEETSKLILNSTNTALLSIQTNDRITATKLFFQIPDSYTSGTNTCVKVSIPASMTSGENYRSQFNQVTFQAPQSGTNTLLDFQRAAFWKIEGCHFYGGNIGVNIENLSNADGGDNILTNSFFWAPRYAIVHWSAGGLQITNNKFLNGYNSTNTSVCYFGAYTEGISTVDLFIRGNSFENYTDYGIIIQPNRKVSFKDIQIQNNQMTDYSDSTGAIPIAMNGGIPNDTITIANIQIQNNIIKSENAPAIYLTRVDNVKVTGNTIGSYKSKNMAYTATQAINATGSVTNLVIGDNSESGQTLTDVLPSTTLQQVLVNATSFNDGDLLYYKSTTGKWVTLPKGTNGQFLKMVSGAPAWSN